MNKDPIFVGKLNELIVEIGLNIRSNRKALGMTQAKLAELADINEKHLSSIENGKETNLSVGYLVSIAVAMNVSVLELFPTKEVIN